MKLKYFFGAIFLLLFVAGSVYGSIYQYTDESGVVRFTDDLSLIPDDQREEVKITESVKNTYNPKEVVPKSAAPVIETPADEIRSDAQELDAIRAELHREYDSLMAEKEALGPAPPKKTKSGVKADYNYKVTDLNRRIDDYQKRRSEFDEKVKTFNNQIGGK
jgi:hypothetical protein